MTTTEERRRPYKNVKKIEIEVALSRVYQHERDFPSAVAILNEALEKKPSSTEARWQLASHTKARERLSVGVGTISRVD